MYIVTLHVITLVIITFDIITLIKSTLAIISNYTSNKFTFLIKLHFL